MTSRKQEGGLLKYMIYLKHLFIDRRYHVLLNFKKNLFRMWDSVRQDIVQFVEANDEMDSEAGLSAVIQYLRKKGNQKELDYVSDMAQKKNTYVEHVIRKVEGSMGMRGSAIAEQNHSSIVHFLGEHVRATISLDSLIERLLKRQRFREEKTNSILIMDASYLRGIIANPTSSATLRTAATMLCRKSYDKFMKGYSMAKYVKVEQAAASCTKKDGYYYCPCPYRMRTLMPCAEEIALNGDASLSEDKFHLRHLKRESLTISMTEYRIPTSHQLDLSGMPSSPCDSKETEEDNPFPFDEDKSMSQATVSIMFMQSLNDTHYYPH